MQFGRACQLIKCGDGFSLHAKNSHVLEKNFQGSKNKQRQTSQGSNLHGGPTRGSDMEMYHLMDPRIMEDFKHYSKGNDVGIKGTFV
jgi:hypothetical protein